MPRHPRLLPSQDQTRCSNALPVPGLIRREKPDPRQQAHTVMSPTHYKSRYLQSEELDIREIRTYASPCSLCSPAPPYTSAPAPTIRVVSPSTTANATPHAPGPPIVGK